MASNSQDLVTVKEIKDGVLLMENGSYCQILMVGGTNFTLKSETEQNSILMSYQDFLNSLDFQLQIIIHSRKINIENYLKELEKRRENETSALLQSQISEYQEFVRSFVKENAIMKKIFLVVVPYYPSGEAAQETLSKLPSLGAIGQKAPARDPALEAEAELQFKKNESQLRQRVDQVVEGLRTIGLETTVLSSEELVELLYNFYNPESTEKEDLVLDPKGH